MDNGSYNSSKAAQPKNASSRIGFLLDYLHGYQETLWHEAEKVALAEGRSIFTFVGQSLIHGNQVDLRTTNKVYDLALSPMIGSYLISGATLGSYITKEEYAACLQPFLGKPSVSIGPVPASVKSVLIENRSGIGRTARHMAEAHGRKRFAFIAGPKGSSESNERFQSFRDALAELGIELDDNLVYWGNFWYNGGAEAIHEFLDVRKATMDAVIAANDYMAIGAMRELIARGRRVPQDISVSGYDDTLEGLTETPSLTTVRQPFPEQTRVALQHLFAGAGAAAPEPLMTEMVVRRSCGCETMSQGLAGRGRMSKIPSPVPDPKDILADVIQVMRVDPRKRDIMLGLIHPAIDGAVRGDFAAFFQATEKAIYECLECNEGLDHWQDFLSIVRGDLLPAMGGVDQAIELENAIGRLRILVSSLSFGAATVKRSKILAFEENVSDVFKTTASLDSFEALGEALGRDLTNLGMRSFYLALREDAVEAHDGDGWTVKGNFKLYAARRDGEDAMAGTTRNAYPALELLPEDVLPRRATALVVMPITFGMVFFGIVAFERGPAEGSVYKLISDQIGANVQNISLSKKSKLVEAAEKARAAAVEALARPMGSSVMEVSKIVDERAVTVKSVGEAAARTREDILATQDMIGRITSGTDQMKKFVEVIDDIASTVSLLGLNAAIEAARAGANGRGFNVIASEIRKLAESTKTNADKIRSLLSGISADVRGSVEAADRSQSTFLRLDADVAQVLASLREIASRMETLSGMSADLLKTM